jgi:ATP-dependent RNA helicase DDX27
VTLVGEADRKMLKAAIKHSAGEDKVRHRVVPAEAVTKWTEKLEDLKGEIAEILEEEKEEKQVRLSNLTIVAVDKDFIQLRQAEMEVKRGQNIIEHEKEIYSRPARTWFQSEKEKRQSQGSFHLVAQECH